MVPRRRGRQQVAAVACDTDDAGPLTAADCVMIVGATVAAFVFSAGILMRCL
jgi:hypothetical protein